MVPDKNGSHYVKTKDGKVYAFRLATNQEQQRRFLKNTRGTK